MSRTVLVTGAAGHLGQAVAAVFRERGARLLLLGRDEGALARLFAGWDGSMVLPVDLLDVEATRAALRTGVERLGPIEALCHIAGGFRMGEAVHETTDATWDFLMDINARTLVNVARAAVPHLLAPGGRIVTVGAGAACQGGARMGAYSASKSAVIRLTEAMSAELRPRGINVNCVLPSIIDTPDNRAAMPGEDPARWVSPRALAEVIAFLASDAARAIHGAAIPVDGDS